jgi:Fe-S cluster assembly protein SufD
VLDREGTSDYLLVVFAGRGDDMISLDLSVLHRAAATAGNILVKGVLQDGACATVRGLIRMEKIARRSNGFFESRTLLAGDQVSAETYPYLEIEADDVKASHAVATSPLDEEQLFYLRSRGIGESAARKLVTDGFFDSILTEVAPKEREKVVSKLEEAKTYLSSKF